MTFGTYFSEEEKERQDREAAREEESANQIWRERRKRKNAEELEGMCKRDKKYIKERNESNRKARIYPYILAGLALLGGTVGIINKNNYYQTKPNGIEATINQEYQNEKSKLDSAYNFMENKADSIYQAKIDSLQKVYKSKLEGRVSE